MKKFLFSLAAVLGFACCDVYIEEPNGPSVVTYGYGYCDNSEPYMAPAEEYHVYYDYYGRYEGECGYWYFGHGEWEEWCYWEGECGWEFVTAWYDW